MNVTVQSAGTVLVTGANRGLGLEYCRQMAAAGWQVLACTRDPGRSPALLEVADVNPGRVRVLALDVVDEGAVEALARELRGTPLDMLINNAGTFGPEGSPGGMRYQSLAHMDYAIWREILEVNLLAPFRADGGACPQPPPRGATGRRHAFQRPGIDCEQPAWVIRTPTAPARPG